MKYQSKTYEMRRFSMLLILFLTFVLIVLLWFSIRAANRGDEKGVGFLLGVSFLVMAEIILIWRQGYHPYRILLMKHGKQVGTTYDENELYNVMCDIVGKENVVKLFDEKECKIE